MAKPDECWSFVTFYKGDKMQSPRTFTSQEDCIKAICAKLSQHALDHEFPMIGLVDMRKPTSGSFQLPPSGLAGTIQLDC